MTFFDIFSRKSGKETKIIKQRVLVDFREKNSLVPSILIQKNINVEFVSLPVADYIFNNIAIERKTVSDLKSSIINKRIISQLLELKQYPAHLLIIEGNQEELYNGKVMHKNAVRGFLISVALEFQTPFIYTSNEEETASYISLICDKKNKSSLPIRASKIILSKEKQMQYILEGFPHIGPIKAKALISKFKTLKNIFSSSVEDLVPILGKKALNFKEIIEN